MKLRNFKLHDFMTDPQFAGRTFNPPSYRAARVTARLLDGDVARGGGVEDEANGVGPGSRRAQRVLRPPHAADLDPGPPHCPADARAAAAHTQ